MRPTHDLATAPGFADAPRESQAVFRAVMDALAHPTRIEPLPARLSPPAPLTPELAAIALTLADIDAPLWLDAPLAANPAVAAYLRFHTGAAIVTDPAEAAFALVAAPADLPDFETFATGTEEYPDRSTTLVLAVDRFNGADAVTVEGPGMAAAQSFAPEPAPSALRARIAGNHALFPRGVDLVFTAPGLVCALPRSSRLAREA